MGLLVVDTNNLVKLGFKNISILRTFKNQLNYPIQKTFKVFKNLKNLFKLKNLNLLL